MNYEGWDMAPMQDFEYPTDYHQRYGHMYPGMTPDISDGMVYPTMYPDIYYRIYPFVHRVCDRMDNPYTLYPSEAQVESMINECYDTCIRSMPDLIDYAEIKQEEQQAESSQLFRRRPLLRDLIGILLVGELFRRRRRFYPYGYGYGY